MGGVKRAPSRGSRGYCQDDNQLGGNAGPRGRCPGRTRRDALRNGRGSRQTVIASRYLDLELTLDVVQMDPMGYGAPLRIGDYREAVGAIGKGPARTAFGQQEEHRGAGHGLMVFVFHLHHRLARRALPDIVDGALALDDHQVQFMHRFLGKRRRARKGDYPRQQTHTLRIRPSAAFIMAVRGGNSNGISPEGYAGDQFWAIGRFAVSAIGVPAPKTKRHYASPSFRSRRHRGIERHQRDYAGHLE